MFNHGLSEPQVCFNNLVPHFNLPTIVNIGSYEKRLEFLANSLAHVLKVSTVFNEDFINMNFDPSYFGSTILEGCCSYSSNFSDELLRKLFNTLIQWVQGKAKGLHSCFLAACRCDYSYGRGCSPCNPLPSFLRILLIIISQVFYHGGKMYNAIHINFFLDKAKLGRHSDNERILGDQPNILSLSLGAERKFRVSDYHDPDQFQDIDLFMVLLFRCMDECRMSLSMKS